MLTFKGLSLPSGVIVREVENTVLPPVNPKTIEIAGRHGGLDFGRTYGMRQINVLIGVKGDSLEEVRSIVRQLAKQLNSENLESLILLDEPDVEYQARVTGESSLKPLYRYEETTIQFLCPDPFPNDLTKETVNLNGTGTTNVNVLGTAETYPTFTINVTASVGSFTITNVVNNVITTLTVNDNFVNGDVVKIDCESGEITVNGSIRNLLTLDTDFIELSSGTNTLDFTGSGTVQMDYSNKWL